MPHSSSTTTLSALARQFRSIEAAHEGLNYRLPALWLQPFRQNGSYVVENPARWFADTIEHLIASPDISTQVKSLTATPDVTGLPGTYSFSPENTSLYMMLARHALAFDHGQASRDLGWTAQGTFVKAIVLLPYLRSLGVNAISLLPVMSLGRVAQKGNLGSVYAIADPFSLDENLSEPLCGMSIDDQFRAFVEAAHLCGMKVFQEFALRTTSRDASWIALHPEWYYWVKEECVRDNAFHPPHFDAAVLKDIDLRVSQSNFHQLPAPPESYTAMFADTPQHVIKESDGNYLGICADGTRCRIPGAFADYPPDDTQPVWSDVSYLRLHTHPEFNYVAYNTVRMYDEQLSDPQYRNDGLWSALESVIPSYIQRFEIDGAVLDMSHALPASLSTAIIRAARELRPDFVFIEENFRLDAASLDKGFNAVLGSWWYHCTCSMDAARYAEELHRSPSPLPFLACPDTHNSPRLFLRASRSQALHTLQLSTTLPNGIRSTLAGTEFGSTQVMNTGLGFSDEELKLYPAEQLPLFSQATMDWESADLDILQSYREYMRRDNSQPT